MERFDPSLSGKMIVLDLRGPGRPRDAGGPLAVVCGLPVLIRTLLVLERAGYDRVLLLVAPEDRAAVDAVLARYPRAPRPFRVVEDAGDTLAPVAGALGEGEGADSATVLVWPAEISFGRMLPELARLHPAPGRLLVGADGTGADEPGRWLALMDGATVRARASASTADVVARAAAEHRVDWSPQARRPIAVVDTKSTRAAERALLRSLRKDADGVVARFDRYVSLAISRRLMALPIRPNHVTAVAVLVGVACGYVVSGGGYLRMLIGALGFQLNSILDGVDGEIARAKLLESAAGQWLDTLADDLSNFSFIVGVSIGSYRTWGSRLYLSLGTVAAVGFLLSSALMYHYIITRVGSGDLNDFAMPWEEKPRSDARAGAAATRASSPTPGPFARLLGRMKWAVRRDTYVFLCTLFGLAGQLRIMVWLFAAGTTATWSLIFGYRTLGPLLRRRLAR